MINTAIINSGRINDRGHIARLIGTTLQLGATITYTCTLTATSGVPPPVVLAISSAQIRKKSGEQTFVSVVIPNGVSSIAAIQARSPGKVSITQHQRYLDGSTISGVIVSADVDQINYTRGARSSSVVLQGHSIITNPAPTIRPLTDTSSYNVTDGVRRLRAAVDYAIEAGDIALFEVEEFAIREIAINLAPGSGTMDVSE